MKIHLLSDVHLEMAPLVGLPGGDVLLLAGDIITADHLRPKRTDKDAARLKNTADAFFKGECAKYKQVYYIAGNHEHYHGLFPQNHDILRAYLEGTNVKFMHNEVVDLGENKMLFGATLWTDFHNGDVWAMMAAKQGMNDYHIIYNQHTEDSSLNVKLRPEDTMVDHKHSMGYLKKFLEVNPDKEFLVMTHMTPSFRSQHPRFGGTDNLLNWSYHTELSGFILDHPNIKTWVHGHTHDSFDYMIDQCRILCNPRGYARPGVSGQENGKFNPTFSFEV